MLGLVDYSSSPESSDASVEQLPTSMVENPAGSAKQVDSGETAHNSNGAIISVEQQKSVLPLVQCAPRQFDHVPGQWAITAMLTGAAPPSIMNATVGQAKICQPGLVVTCPRIHPCGEQLSRCRRTQCWTTSAPRHHLFSLPGHTIAPHLLMWRRILERRRAVLGRTATM